MIYPNITKRKGLRHEIFLNKENSFTKLKIEDSHKTIFSASFIQEKIKHFVFNFNNNSKLMYTVQQQNL